MAARWPAPLGQRRGRLRHQGAREELDEPLRFRRGAVCAADCRGVGLQSDCRPGVSARESRVRGQRHHRSASPAPHGRWPARRRVRHVRGFCFLPYQNDTSCPRGVTAERWARRTHSRATRSAARPGRRTQTVLCALTARSDRTWSRRPASHRSSDPAAQARVPGVVTKAFVPAGPASSSVFLRDRAKTAAKRAGRAPPRRRAEGRR